MKTKLLFSLVIFCLVLSTGFLYGQSELKIKNDFTNSAFDALLKYFYNKMNADETVNMVNQIYEFNDETDLIKKWLIVMALEKYKENLEFSSDDLKYALTDLPKPDLSKLRSNFGADLAELGLTENDFFKVSDASQLADLLINADYFYRKGQFKNALIVYYSILDFLGTDEYAGLKIKSCIDKIKAGAAAEGGDSKDSDMIVYYKLVFDESISMGDRQNALNYMNKVGRINSKEPWLKSAVVKLNSLAVDVEFSSRESNVEVFIEGESIGEVPCNASLKPDKYNVFYKKDRIAISSTVDLAGFRESVKKVTIDYKVGENVYGVLLQNLVTADQLKQFKNSIPDEYKSRLIEIPSSDKFIVFLDPVWTEKEAAEKAAEKCTIPVIKVIETKAKFFKY